MGEEQRRILQDFNAGGRKNDDAQGQSGSAESERPDAGSTGSNDGKAGGAGPSRPSNAPKGKTPVKGGAKPGAKGAKKSGEELTPEEKARSKRIFWGSVTIFALLALFTFWLINPMGGYTSVKTSEGIAYLQSQEIKNVEITDGSQIVKIDLVNKVTPTDDEGKARDKTDKVRFQYVDAQAETVAKAVAEAKAKFGYNAVVPQQSFLASMISLLLPMLLLVGIFIWLFPRLQSGMTQFGKVKKDGLESDLPDVNFGDVAGVDEAVEELREIKEFLETPEKFRKMGAKIPKGVLLYGPPGTGKTLLARAVAGEAGVPFFHISASEFVEMFVGVGASRVRDLFTKAKKTAPAIIFVDEIDAVGRNRGVGIGGGNDEREQTLNQLLVEMDGFDERTNVIVVAATNRPDVLDPALLRPGRFDRQIAVDAPDLPGREKILSVHAEGKPLAPTVSLEAIARRTPGFTGADLANLLNEAALLAARQGHEVITDLDIDEAIDRVMAGPQRRTRVMNPREKRMTAYHEGGHAVAAAALNHTDPVTKVTILPRGRALGYTMVMPTEDKYSTSRNELLDQMVYAMGGRVAEEIVFLDPSTGAANDIQKATKIARAMVTEYGMSSRVGAVRLTADDSDPMRRGLAGSPSEHSDAMAQIVDEEVRELIDTAHVEATAVLSANRHVLDRLAELLLEKETVLENELKEVFADIVKAPERVRWLAREEN